MLEGGQPAATFRMTFLTKCQALQERIAGGRGKRPQRRRLEISPPEMERTRPLSSPAHLPGPRVGEASELSSGMPPASVGTRREASTITALVFFEKRKKNQNPPGRPKSRGSSYRWTAARCSPETCSAGPPVPAGRQPWSSSRLPGLWGRPAPCLTAAGGRVRSQRAFPAPRAPCAPQPRSAGAAAGSRCRPRCAPHLPAAARPGVRSSAPVLRAPRPPPVGGGSQPVQGAPYRARNPGDPAAAGSRGARLEPERHPLGSAGSVSRVRLGLGAEQLSW